MPADSVNVSLKIFPGDVITSSVVITGPGQILVQVKDRTRRTSFTKHLTMATPDLTSAEWIAEAPSECSASGFCREIPLTNFGTVNFTKTYAIGQCRQGNDHEPELDDDGAPADPQARRFFGDQGDPSSRIGRSRRCTERPDGGRQRLHAQLAGEPERPRHDDGVAAAWPSGATSGNAALESRRSGRGLNSLTQ